MRPMMMGCCLATNDLMKPPLGTQPPGSMFSIETSSVLGGSSDTCRRITPLGTRTVARVQPLCGACTLVHRQRALCTAPARTYRAARMIDRSHEEHDALVVETAVAAHDAHIARAQHQLALIPAGRTRARSSAAQRSCARSGVPHVRHIDRRAEVLQPVRANKHVVPFVPQPHVRVHVQHVLCSRPRQRMRAARRTHAP